MPRYVIFALGTWGDVRPFVALGSALRQNGDDVLIIAPQEFGPWVQARGLAFAGLKVNIKAMIDSLDVNTNPLGGMKAMKTVIAPALEGTVHEVAAVVREGDTLLMGEMGQVLLHGLIDQHQLRVVHLALQPTAPTSAFPLLNQPRLPAWLPGRGAYHKISAQMNRRMTWSTLGPQGNRLRTEELGLPALSLAEHRARLRDTPWLMLVSPQVVPRPVDWPASHQVTGFIFDEDPAWEPPAALLRFLAAGPKPVYIGFGSMSDQDPEATTRMILDGVRQSGQRAVLLSGWAGIGAENLPESVFLLDYAPHTWLFPRMAAVVHHGGAGTTGSGLRAGVPSIVTPISADQPFWGRRVHELGVGPKPVPRKHLTAEKLAAALREATTDQAMQQRAAALGAAIAAEDGAGEAVRVIHHLRGGTG